MVHLELGGARSEGTDVEGDCLGAKASAEDGFIQISKSEGGHSPLLGELIEEVWDGSLEVGVSVVRCRPCHQHSLVEVVHWDVGVGIGDINEPATTREDWDGLELGANRDWVDNTSWRKVGAGDGQFLEANVNWTTEGVLCDGHGESAFGRLHIEVNNSVGVLVSDVGDLNVSTVVGELKTTIETSESGSTNTVCLGSSVVDSGSTGTIVGAAGFGITRTFAKSVTIRIAVNTIFTTGNVTNSITTSGLTSNDFTRGQESHDSADIVQFGGVWSERSQSVQH